MNIFDEHYILRKNVLKARLAFMETIPRTGVIINNFVTQLQVQVKYCEFGDSAKEQVPDKVLFHLSNISLKAKMLRGENLTLERLI